MSNPLIRPNDPRFQRQEVHDETGKNRFADDQPPSGESADAQQDIFATPNSTGERAYRPEYVSDQPSRSKLLLVLATVSLALDASGALAIWQEQWLLAALLLFAGLITGAIGWYVAADEFVGLKAGVVAAEYRPAAIAGMAIATLGVLSALGLAASAVFYYFQTAGL